MNRQCKCDLCGKTFIPLWSEQDAMKEYRQTFGWTNEADIDNEGLATLCDTCYDLFKVWYKDKTLKPHDN